MQRFAVLLTLVLSFIAPLAIPAAHGAEPGTAAPSPCGRHQRAAKRRAEDKPKKKEKDSKKPYGFEL